MGPGEDRRQDDLEHDHQDHRYRSLPKQRCQSEADNEPDNRFEFDPQPGLDHQGIGRVEKLGGVTRIIPPGNQHGRSFELSGRDLH
jgi:hypothetical protein